MQCPLCKKPKVDVIKLHGLTAEYDCPDAGYNSDEALDMYQLKSKLNHSKRRQNGMSERIVSLQLELEEEKKKNESVRRLPPSHPLFFPLVI